MEARTYGLGSETYRAVKALYLSAFPPEQRYCPEALWLTGLLRSRTENLAWFDDSRLAGMTYTVDTGRNLYIYYIAVDPALRSRGYGSAILDCLRQRHPDRVLILDVDAPDPESPAYETQLRRVDFYLRNGFHALDHHVITEGKRLDILSTSEDFDASEYWRAFRLMSQPMLARLKGLQKRLGIWK